MSPTRLTKMDELNYVITERNTNHFKFLMESNRIPYRVAIFKTIESGSYRLFEIVKRYHPEPDADIELECLHASFRGHLNIYENIYFDEEIEEFNPYSENMYLFHGRFDKVNLVEINIYDLLSPNTIPVTVCDYIAQTVPNNSCLITGVLLAYCIHNSENYIRLKDNQHLFIMDIMFQHATQNDNHKLKLFLLDQFRQTRQYTTYEYTNRKSSFQKERQYVTDNHDLAMYDHYLMKSPADINNGKLLKVKGNTVYTNNKIHPNNVCLSMEMFEWQNSNMVENDVDAYFEQVIDHVNYSIDEGILFKL